METVWFQMMAPLHLQKLEAFIHWLLLHREPFSIEYDSQNVGVTGFEMEALHLKWTLE